MDLSLADNHRGANSKHGEEMTIRQKILEVLLSFGKRKDILTSEICEKMELKYRHIYSIPEMELLLTELTKTTGLKTSGKVVARAPVRFIHKSDSEPEPEPKSDTELLFMPYVSDNNGESIT